MEIAVSAERVWSVLGGFDSLPLWLQPIRRSTLGEGGRVRHLETVTGEAIVERLLTFNESDRCYSYALLESPSPVRDYVGTMSVRDGGNGHALATWASRFLADGIGEDEIKAQYEQIYRGGLAHLKTLLESA
jgi:hypothetical protein